MHIISLDFDQNAMQFVGGQKAKEIAQQKVGEKYRIYNNIPVMITCENVVNIVQKRLANEVEEEQTKTTKNEAVAKQTECAQKYAAITATSAKQLLCQSVYVCVYVCISDLCVCVCASAFPAAA